MSEADRARVRFDLEESEADRFCTSGQPDFLGPPPDLLTHRF